MCSALQQGHVLSQGCTQGAGWALRHHLMIPSQDSVPLSISPSSSSLLLLKSSPRTSPPATAFVHWSRQKGRKRGLRAGLPSSWSCTPHDPPRFLLICWSEKLTPHFKGRSLSPSLAACFHGDRPFLPTAIQPPACHRQTCWRAAKGR